MALELLTNFHEKTFPSELSIKLFVSGAPARLQGLCVSRRERHARYEGFRSGHYRGNSGNRAGDRRILVASGGKVLLVDESEGRLEEAKKSLESLGGDTVALACDVVSEADCARLARKAIDLFGKINLVAPCAGITRDSLVLDTDESTGKVTGKMSLDHFRSVISINLTGVFLTVRECAGQMINHDCRGLICLISSTSSLGAAEQLNYSSVNAALSVAPRVLTAEFFRRGLAGRIRCVAIAPGYVDTSVLSNVDEKPAGKALDQVPIGRLIDPYEIASLGWKSHRGPYRARRPNSRR